MQTVNRFEITLSHLLHCYKAANRLCVLSATPYSGAEFLVPSLANRLSVPKITIICSPSRKLLWQSCLATREFSQAPIEIVCCRSRKTLWPSYLDDACIASAATVEGLSHLCNNTEDARRLWVIDQCSERNYGQLRTLSQAASEHDKFLLLQFNQQQVSACAVVSDLFIGSLTDDSYNALTSCEYGVNAVHMPLDTQLMASSDDCCVLVAEDPEVPEHAIVRDGMWKLMRDGLSSELLVGNAADEYYDAIEYFKLPLFQRRAWFHLNQSPSSRVILLLNYQRHVDFVLAAMDLPDVRDRLHVTTYSSLGDPLAPVDLLLSSRLSCALNKSEINQNNNNNSSCFLIASPTRYFEAFQHAYLTFRRSILGRLRLELLVEHQQELWQLGSLRLQEFDTCSPVSNVAFPALWPLRNFDDESRRAENSGAIWGLQRSIELCECHVLPLPCSFHEAISQRYQKPQRIAELIRRIPNSCNYLASLPADLLQRILCSPALVTPLPVQ